MLEKACQKDGFFRGSYPCLLKGSLKGKKWGKVGEGVNKVRSNWRYLQGDPLESLKRAFKGNSNPLLIPNCLYPYLPISSRIVFHHFPTKTALKGIGTLKKSFKRIGTPKIIDSSPYLFILFSCFPSKMPLKQD